MKALAFASSALLFAAVASADRSQRESEHNVRLAQSSITVSIANLGCTTPVGSGAFAARSWSWGATNSTSFNSGGGGGAGKTTINPLSIKKAFDACSPLLFGAVAGGHHFPTLTLTDRDDEGNVVATVMLTDVELSSWSVGSSVHDETPDESLTFVFRKVCLTGNGTTVICYDVALNKIV
jgi:type VI protein secretion system component Hcp